MMDQEVRPLFDDPGASPELRNFVALARSDGPSQADLDRLAARLGPALGVSAGLAVAAGAAASLGTPPAELAVLQPAAAAKLGLFGHLLASAGARLLAVGLAAGIGAGLWWYAGSPPAAGGHPAVQPAIPSPPEPAALVPALAPSTATAPAHTQLSAPAVVESAPAQSSAAVPQAGSARRRAAEHPHPHGAGTAPRTLAAAVKEQPRADAPAAAPAAVPAPSELSLIQQAEAARGRPAEALALLGTHARLYPDGNLAQEREVLAIELLFKVGQPDRARARAAQFEARYPRSAHLPRVQALLARAPRE